MAALAAAALILVICMVPMRMAGICSRREEESLIKTPEDCEGRGPNMTAHWFVYDFEVCIGTDDLKRALAIINYHGYDLVAVTQTMDKYTVFFRRLAG